MTDVRVLRAQQPTAAPLQKPEFTDLIRLIKAADLLTSNASNYVARLAVAGALFAGGWLAFFAVGNSWLQLLVAVYMAFIFTQVSYLAHDAGHRQIFAKRRANEACLMITGNLAVGIASGWWFSKHKQHHLHPNNPALDPDAQVTLVAHSQSQFRAKAGFTRAFAKRQHWLYFPLLALEAFWLHISSVALLATRSSPKRKLEALTLAAHFALYGAAVFTVLSPMKALAFVVVHQALFGLHLGSAFATNHKGMALFEDEEPPFLERQVLSSRNVRGGRVTDFMLGGLNYQIEHHLFPSMPRPNLAKAQPIVKTFCAANGLPYEECGPIESYREVLRHFAIMSRTEP